MVVFDHSVPLVFDYLLAGCFYLRFQWLSGLVVFGGAFWWHLLGFTVLVDIDRAVVGWYFPKLRG